MIEYLVNKSWFKNANHAIWFFLSMFIMLIMVTTLFYGFQIWMLAIVALVIHIPSFATASYKKFKNIQSEIYSVDCIWFNALMALVYFVILLIMYSKF